MEEVVSSNLTRSTKTSPNTSKTYRVALSALTSVLSLVRSTQGPPPTSVLGIHGPPINTPRPH